MCVSKVRVPNRDPCFPTSPFFFARTGCQLKERGHAAKHIIAQILQSQTHTFLELPEARTITWQVAAPYRFAKESKNLTWDHGRSSIIKIRPRQPQSINQFMLLGWDMSLFHALSGRSADHRSKHAQHMAPTYDRGYYAAPTLQHPFLLYHRLPQAATCVQQQLSTGNQKKASGNQFSAQWCAISPSG